MPFDLLNPVNFANTLGLYALLSIIPLILIYLLRPRPLKIKIPSLMFLFELEKRKRLIVLRKFIKDPLFLIQLFVLIMVSLAVAEPFIISEEEAGGGSTVIVLDASASMQADGRFEKAVEQAKNFLSSKNTIILAESVPVMVIRESPSGSASDALGKLKAKATEADISSAILLGRRMLPEGGRIVVLSDFASFIGDSPDIARKLAEASGINVVFVTVSGRTDNVGIVNGWFESGNYKIDIKNFNADSKDVRIDVTTDSKSVLSSTLNIKGQSSGFFEISNLQPGETKISLGVEDALPVDNNAYVIIPESVKRDILYIADDAKKPSLIALGLIPYTTVKQVDTSGIPALSGIIFVSAALSQEAAKSLADYVNGGGNAVVIATPDLKDMEMLPIELDSLANSTSLTVVQPSRITEGINIEKTDVRKHFKARLKPGATALVEGSDGSAMLAYWKFGRGTVIYSGLADPRGNIFDPLNENVWNDFHAQPDYPLFWKQMLEWISGSLDVSEYNAKTGQFIKLPAASDIKTPGSSINTDLLLLDEVGIYGLPDKEVAVNLYDEKESNLAGGIPQAAEQKELTFNPQIIRAPKYFDIYLIMLAMFLVFFELYYLHWRGEL